jgi:hypothetical protein
MADQVADKVDATAPAVEAPVASTDSAAPEAASSKSETKTEDVEAVKEEKAAEGTNEFLCR